MWQWSQFTVSHSLADRGLDDKRIVYNTRTRRCVLMDDSAWQSVDSWIAAGHATGAPAPAMLPALVRDAFVSGSDRDEGREWLEHFEAQRRNPRCIFPLLAVTTGCNIGCTYCYEEGIQPEVMGPEVASACVRWMERRIVEDGVRDVRPGLFGGEPLLYPRLLFQIMDEFAGLRERHRIAGGFYSSSNGMLLTDDLARHLAAKGLDQLQISLDGPPEIHNRRRRGKRGQASFDESLEGIRVAVRHIKSVTLKYNFDRENQDALRDLLDVLDREQLASHLTIKLETIARQFADSRVVHETGLVIEPDTEELANAYAALSLDCERRGIRVTRDTAHTTPCMFSSEHGVIIGPDGSIYKCISLVGRKKFAVGSVFDGDYHRPSYDAQMDVGKRVEDCISEKCPYLPVCGGGCAYESIVRTGDFGLRYCTKEFLSRYHYLGYLRQYEGRLASLGMRPVSADELRWSVPAAILEGPLVQIQPVR